jgi:hypothetical protein
MKNFFPTIQAVKDIFRVRTHTHPTRDWFIILGCAALLTGISVGWNIWLYVSVTDTDVRAAQEVAVPAFDTSAVDAVEKAYEARGEEAARYQGAYRFVDPSR